MKFKFYTREPKSNRWKVPYFLAKANAFVSCGEGYETARFCIIDAQLSFQKLFEETTGEEYQKANYTFLDPGWVTNIGHMAMLSIFPKLELSNLAPKKTKILFYVSAANPALLELYQRFYKIIKINPKSLAKDLIVNRDILQPMGAYDTFDGIKDEYEAHNYAERAYRDKFALTPFFSPNEVDEEFVLNSLNLKERSKLLSPFVILHVRNSPALRTRSANNADILTYIPAIKFLLNNGITVVRMGNSAMPNLKELEKSNTNFVDYAHSQYRSPSLDLYLWSHAKFSICTSSGPAWIPNEFGIPSLLTNAPHLSMIYGISGFFIPHKYFDIKSNLRLNYETVVRSGFGSSWSETGKGMRRERNTENEILQATIDMFEKYILLKPLNSYPQLSFIKHDMEISPSFYENNLDLFKN
jgi:putative glycosyltransferase (TIGR04372 family)